jgi:hypothetical protein
VVRPLLARDPAALREERDAQQALLEASWRARARFYPCPRPATPPTLRQLAILRRIELLDVVLHTLEPPAPAGRESAPCSVEYTTSPHPGQVVVTCLLEGTVTRSWGHGERSRARSFALLREECPCGGWHEEGELVPEEDEEDDEDEPVEVAVRECPHSLEVDEQDEVPLDLLRVIRRCLLCDRRRDRALELLQLQQDLRDRYRLPSSPWTPAERATDTD